MTEDILFQLWGKTNELDKNGRLKEWSYHPAICHMVDVGYVAERWLQMSPDIMSRFQRFAPDIDGDILRRIIVMLVALHDLGKIHRMFQAKSEKGWKNGYGSCSDNGIDRIEGYVGFDHGFATTRILRELYDDELLTWKSWKTMIDMVAAHHGQMYDVSTLKGAGGVSLSSIDRPQILKAIDIIGDMFGIPDATHADLPKAPVSKGFEMLLAGFTSVADWIGSNSGVFVFAPEVKCRVDLENYLTNLRRRGVADISLAENGLLPEFRSNVSSYGDLFDFLSDERNLRPLQHAAIGVPFGDATGSEMVIVEAPMGMGKTELALFLAGRAISAGKAGGIYFALPTQASSNSLFERINKFADNVRAPDSDISLVLAHGGQRFEKKYQAVRRRTEKRRKIQMERSRQAIGSYRDSTAPPSETIAPEWLASSSKRSLLAAIGVGTIDQALLGAIMVKHAFVRLFALAGKVVIFDEIHAYDTYMNVVIRHLLEWLHVLDVKVILLSATLPRKLRNDLLGAYDIQPPETAAPPECDPYPQIIYGFKNAECRTILSDAHSNAAEDPRLPTNIHINSHAVLNDDRTVYGIALAKELVADGGCVAWIRNTVREAQNAWTGLVAMKTEGLLDDVEIRLFHARYIRGDRNRIESDILDILNKDSTARPLRMIVVATQVIEQSVDIDFDAMISDLAPVDLLLQRAGRLWRHPRDLHHRHSHTDRRLQVLLPDDDAIHALMFGSSSYVYEAEILARSAVMVRENTEWSLPAACRSLVALLYDTGTDTWTAERMRVDPARLDTVRTRQENLEAHMSSTASTILMPQPTSRTLGMRNAQSDDERSDNVALATRLGGSSATVILVRELDGLITFVAKFKDDSEWSITKPPAADDYKKLHELEEMVMLSSVSFPWFESLESGPLPSAVDRLQQWWKDRHPYDRKVFLVVNANGNFEHPQISGTYQSNGAGFVFAKTRKSSTSENDNYEEL